MIFNSFNNNYRSFNNRKGEGTKTQQNSDIEGKPLRPDTNINHWDSKYTVSIDVLKEEYLQSLFRIRNVDEKANKYMLLLSIIITGFFVIASSNIIDNLNFDYSKSIYSFLITLISLSTFFVSAVYSVLIFKRLLNCFDLVDTRRMPNIVDTLNKTKSIDSLEYKHHIIKCYQEAIENTHRTASKKQENLRKVSRHVRFFIPLFSITLFLLITLKVIG